MSILSCLDICGTEVSHELVDLVDPIGIPPGMRHVLDQATRDVQPRLREEVVLPRRGLPSKLKLDKGQLPGPPPGFHVVPSFVRASPEFSKRDGLEFGFSV